MRIRLTIAASFCLLGALNAQQDTGRQPGGNQRGGSIANTIRTTPPGSRQSSDAFTGGRVEQPIYVSGQVVMPNGDSPPELVKVEQHCSGVLRHDEYTKPNGNFNISQIGGMASSSDFDAGIGSSSTELTNRGTKLDAFGALDLTDCNVTAVLSGHRSTSIRLGRRRSLDSPDIGRIVLTPMEGVRGNSVSVTSLEAPPKAQKSYEKASEESLKAMPDLKKMLLNLNEALKHYPKHAAAWELLGRTKLTEGDIPGAREAFGKSISADPDFMRPYAPLIKIFAETGEFEAAIQAAEVALDLNPHADDVRFFQGVSLMQTGRYKEAAEAATDVVNRGAAANFPQVYQILGVSYANLGHVELSARYFRIFLDRAPGAKAAAAVRKQLDSWEQAGTIEPLPAADPTPAAAPPTLKRWAQSKL